MALHLRSLNETARSLRYACGKKFLYHIGDSLPVDGRMEVGVRAIAAAAARELLGGSCDHMIQYDNCSVVRNYPLLALLRRVDRF